MSLKEVQRNHVEILKQDICILNTMRKTIDDKIDIDQMRSQYPKMYLDFNRIQGNVDTYNRLDFSEESSIIQLDQRQKNILLAIQSMIDSRVLYYDSIIRNGLRNTIEIYYIFHKLIYFYCRRIPIDGAFKDIKFDTDKAIEKLNIVLKGLTLN